MITKIKKDIRTFETDCPLFFGFYGTHLGAAVDDEVERIAKNYGVDEDNIVFDYEEACKDLSVLYVNEIERIIISDIGIDIKLEFVELHSPRFYNFSNDRAFVKMTVDIERVIDQCMWSKKDVEQYVKDNFTSAPGFISFVPNDFNEWIETIRTKGDRWEIMVSELLTFLLILNGIDDLYIIDWIVGNFYIDYEIKNND